MEASIQAVVGGLEAAHMYKMIYACKATLFMFDYLITLGHEVELIWPRCGVVELLFYAARYSAWPEVCMEIVLWFGPFDAHGCNAAATYISSSLLIGMILGQAIIVVRTWALWNGSPVLHALFIAAFVVVIGACIYIEIEWTSNTKFQQSRTLSPNLQGCFATSAYRMGYLPWLVFTCVDSCLLILTTIKAVQHFRPGSLRLTAALYQDAFLYFTFMLVFSLANVLVWLLAAPQFQLLLVGWARILYSALACRIVINLRAAAKSLESTTATLATDHRISFQPQSTMRGMVRSQRADGDPL